MESKFLKVAFVFYPATILQDIFHHFNASLEKYPLKTKRPNEISKKSSATS